MDEEKKRAVQAKLDVLVRAFQGVLYEEDETFLKNMKTKNLAGDDISKYQFWEWTQGVGLYGIWKYFIYKKDETYLNILTEYYDRQLAIGLPAKNVNTVTPLLPMSYVAEYTGNETYMTVCKEWAEWIYKKFPRTKEGGFQHITSDSLNDQEIWDDTLFMTVLFLANMGRILKRGDYVEEAEYQFLIHIKYLTDRKTGLWFHGWTFKENSNFARALWGRGNCWITAAIPEFLQMVQCSKAVRKTLTQSWVRQVEALAKYQDATGMWHTLIDDESSYVESSATCGFAYGILQGVHMGMIDPSYEEYAFKAIQPILDYIDREGVLHQVSYGTPMGRTDKNFYKEIELKPMPYGQALAILFLIEVQIFTAEKK